MGGFMIILDVPYISSRDDLVAMPDLSAATTMLIDYTKAQEESDMKKLDLF